MDSLRHRVMRQGKTEPPFTGRYLEHRQRGTYRCGQCSCILFTYQQKFHSGCGWPSFLEGSPQVRVRPDARVADAQEAVCAQCDGHLGHLFGSDHYCINSVALDFVPLDLEQVLAGDSLRVWQGELPLAKEWPATLLTYARHLDIARALIQSGARVDQENPEDGTTSLHAAAERGDLKMLELLWTAGGESARDRFDFIGRTPLACAAAGGHIQVMESLLRKGAALEAWCERRKGVTPLHEACFCDQREAAMWLFQRGADPDLAVGLNSSPRELRGDWFG